MTTHVFVVNSRTFKLHLEYMFAGTGSKKDKVDFNNRSATGLKPKTEIKLVNMIADGCRIRKNDKILFYLQQDTTRHNKNNLAEGKFFGVFKAKHDWVFLDNNDESQFLKNELGKSLTFRVLIEPDVVYQKGITEWEALDDIQDVQSPDQMLWSLIYRKLRGNRGNIAIAIKESDRLIELIKRNSCGNIANNSLPLTFDKDNQLIVNTSNNHRYIGRQEEINVLPRLIEKHNHRRSAEAHLQAYITKNLGLKINSSLDNCFFNKSSKLNWLGNEVGCGVGMQSIDLLIDKTEENNKILMPVELKSTSLPDFICNQLKRYVDWIKRYYDKQSVYKIIPTIICLKHTSRQKKKFNNCCKLLRNFNAEYQNRCLPIKLIEYCIDGENIEFEMVDYED